jgi:hypothetical protein
MILDWARRGLQLLGPEGWREASAALKRAKQSLIHVNRLLAQSNPEYYSRVSDREMGNLADIALIASMYIFTVYSSLKAQDFGAEEALEATLASVFSEGFLEAFATVLKATEKAGRRELKPD